MYEIFSEQPERGRQFASAMESFYKGKGADLRYVTESFQWDDLSDGATVVDVGGSGGHVSFAIARAFPTLRLVVQNLSQVVSAAEKNIPDDLAGATIPDGSRPRVSFMAHDFIQEQQPVVGAEVYLFRWIFHNWPDNLVRYAIRILRGLVPALKHGAKVVVCDHVLPPPGSITKHEEMKLRCVTFFLWNQSWKKTHCVYIVRPWS